MGEIVRVAEGNLARGARPGDGQLALRIRIPENNISDGMTTFRAGIPGFEDERIRSLSQVKGSEATRRTNIANRLIAIPERFC
jgi:hypothetical protein